MTTGLARRPRLADIAARTGVSVSTVSRVLSNEPGISTAVRDEVTRCARELGYTLRGPLPDFGPFLVLLTCDQASGALGVFYEDVLAGLREAAADLGAQIDVRIVFDGMLSAGIAELAGSGIAGLFLVGLEPPDALVRDLAARGVALVGVNAADPSMRFDCVAPANFYGAYAATHALLEKGHRNILHLTHAHRPTIHQRQRGFEAAIASVPGAQGRVLTVPVGGQTHVLSRDVLAAALAKDGAPTAAFCMNDVIGLGAMEAIALAGRTPQSFGIVGFDDLPCASMTRPRLATMAVDRAGIGREAWALMRQRLDRPEAPIRQVEIGVSFVTGGTLP